MDFEAGLIAAVVRQGYDNFVDSVFDPKWASKDCNRILYALNEHWQKFNVTMGFNALQQICDSSFESLPEEPIGFWVEHLRKKYLSNSLNESLSEASKTVRTNPELSYERLIQDLTELSSSHSSDSQLIPVFSKELLEDDLEKANTKKGITTLSSVFDDRVRGWGEQDLIVMAARPGVGKCHGKGTKILMFDGTVKCVEDIVVGDKLMGPDSNPRNVLSLARGLEEMFLISPQKGNPWTCNKSHILSLKASMSHLHGRQKGCIHDISLEDYLNSTPFYKYQMKLYRTKITFPEKPLPVDPYSIGLTIGDITRSNVDFEAISYLEKHNLNLSIPKDYLINSSENQMELLAGILDSCGRFFNGSYSILHHDSLLDDVTFLVRCLGFYATKRRKKIETEKPCLYISGEIQSIPCKIKKAKPLSIKRDILITGFTVKPLGIGDYYGFEIDGDRRYCLEDTTVTHNTFALLYNCLRAWEERKKVILAITEMSARSIRLRAAAMACKVDYGRIRSGSLISIERQKVNACLDLWEQQELLGNFVLYGDSFNVTLEALEAKVHSFRPDFVAIDGVYLLKCLKVKEKDKYRRIAELFDELKSFAKRINRPVMVTTQLNRPPNGKADAVGLERLAFSDNVGMVSDYIIFLEQTEAMKRARLMEIQFGKMREADNYDPMYLNWDFSTWDFGDVQKTEALSRITEAEEELKKEKNSSGDGAIKASPDFTPRKKKEFVDYRARQIND